jgi:hypothetical protein
MPGQHAKLSPSSAERWITCPGSVALSAKMPKQGSSVYADEGTAAHALGELLARAHILHELDETELELAISQFRRANAQFVEEDDAFAEMHRHALAYVEVLERKLAEVPGSVLFLEQRLDAGVPTVWGTSDAVIVSPIHLEVVDFKYGAGIRVEAYENPQLRLYALGALDTYGDLLGDTQYVKWTVYQPRIGDGHERSEEMHPAALRAWRTYVATPRAVEALSPGARFQPSESACRWCPASGRCKAQLEAVFGEDDESIVGDDPELMTPAELADALDKVEDVRIWLNAVEKIALDLAYSESVPIPRYKVVRSGGLRSIPNQHMAIKTLIEAGYAEAAVAETKLRGITHLEKLVGKAKFEHLLGALIVKSDGREALVPESDKREAISPNSEAADEFSVYEEEEEPE